MLRKKDFSIKKEGHCSTWCHTVNGQIYHTWKMAYMMQVSGLWLENSETVKMFRPHLFRSSSSFDSSSSLSVLTPKREMLLLEREGPWETFLTPLICVISCCFCCFFFSRVLDIGDGISTSFCLSVEELNHGLILVQCQKNMLLFFVIFFQICFRPWTQVQLRNTYCGLFPLGFINTAIHSTSVPSFPSSLTPSPLSTCSHRLNSHCSFIPLPLSTPPDTSSHFSPNPLHLTAGDSRLISCLFSLHRSVHSKSEGWGLHTVEALAHSVNCRFFKNS